MDNGVLIASIGKVSSINVNPKLARHHVANADEGLKRKSKAAAAKDSMDGEAGIGKFCDGGVVADVMGRISNFCAVLIQALE